MKSILLAVLLDLILGDPYSFPPHPVKLMGRIIYGEEKFIRDQKLPLKTAGFLISILNISLSFLIPYFLLKAFEGQKK